MNALLWTHCIFQMLDYIGHIFAGNRRLEIRSNGFRSTFLMDIHRGRSCWYCWDNIAGSYTLRR